MAMRFALINFILVLLFNNAIAEEKNLLSKNREIPTLKTNSFKDVMTYKNRWEFHDFLIKNGLNSLNMFKEIKKRGYLKNNTDFLKALLISVLELDYDPKMAKTILDMLDNADFYLKDGESPLFYAAYFDRKDIVKIILSKGGNPNPSKSAYNPILFSIRMANWELFRVLSEGANLSNDDLKKLKASIWIHPSELKKIPNDIKIKYTIFSSAKPQNHDYFSSHLADEYIKDGAFQRVFQEKVMHSYFFFKNKLLKANHNLGFGNFGDGEGSFFPSEVKGRTIFLFKEPRWDSKVVSSFKIENLFGLYDRFAFSEPYGYDQMGIPTKEVNNHWLLVNEGWIHSSLFYFFEPIDVHLKNGLLESKNHGDVFYSINGKKVNLKNKEELIKGKGLDVTNAVWKDGELWVEVTSYGNSICDGNVKGLDFPVWLKPFDKNGSEKFISYSKGC